MEFSQILGFLKILGESMKLVLKNGKSIASITTLSLLFSSSLFLLFGYCYQTAMTYITDSIMNSNINIPQIIICFTIIFSVELCFMFGIIAIAQASRMATILATATSYFDTKTSLQDLFSMVRTKWRSPFTFNIFHRGSSSAYSCRHRMMHFLCIVAVSVAISLVMFNPNPITITIISVVEVSLLVFQLYASVVWVLAGIIPVVEDVCEAAEAMEKAEKLVQGQRLHGFMLNLLLNVIGLIILFSLWMIVDDKGSLNLVVYGLFFLNYCSLTGIFVSVVYTVYYFQCKEYHGEKLQALPGNFHYTTVHNDIP
ncbi:hypothetical protein C2S52_010634 [Perilla frutescens var. hirtella]|nr:hypothetical protein C2S52_010634 [Perilla frutescens var. hirtella]KAH6817464.1 hypothetical protein C2S51_001067 [Perilla frutescens var. frutescens]